MSWINNLTFSYSIIGAIGLIYFGVKTLAVGQQELSDVLLHRVLKGLRENKKINYFKGVLFSFLSCSTLASSSTIIGLVNGGLIRFRAALGLIAGSNLGVPLILIVLAPIGPRFGLLFSAIGLLPFLLGGGITFRSLGGALSGIGLILLGEGFVYNAFSHLDLNIFLPLQGISPLWGILLGGLLGLLCRSTLVSILILCAIIPLKITSFDYFYYMVLGANLGASIPIYFFHKKGNVEGQRIALGQIVFNGLVVILGLILWILTLSLLNGSIFKASPLGLAIVHLILNFVIGLVFLVFENKIDSFLKWIIADETYQGNYELEVLGRSIDMIPALSITQARLHLFKLVDVVNRLFLLTGEYMRADHVSARTLAKIKDYERIADNMYSEMGYFLGELTVNHLSSYQAQQAQTLNRIAQELETISDYVDSLATSATRLKESGHFSGELQREVGEMTEKVQRLYFTVMTKENSFEGHSSDKVYSKGRELKEEIRELSFTLLEKLKLDGVPSKVLLDVNELTFSLRKIRGLTLKIYKCFIDFGS